MVTLRVVITADSYQISPEARQYASVATGCPIQPGCSALLSRQLLGFKVRAASGRYARGSVS